MTPMASFLGLHQQANHQRLPDVSPIYRAASGVHRRYGTTGSQAGECFAGVVSVAGSTV
jgi:hypothetical protein